MIRFVLPTLTFLVGLGIGVAGTYLPTREKWWGLGHETGEIHGRSTVMRDLCAFARPGKPPARVDLVLDVKAERLSAVREGEGIVLWCE